MIVSALTRDGFQVVRIFIAKPNIWIEIENNRYNSTPLAFKRAFEVVDGLAPDDIQQFYLVISVDHIYQTGLKAARGLLRSFTEVRIDKDLFLTFSKMSMDRNELWADFPPAKRAGPGSGHAAGSLGDQVQAQFHHVPERSVRFFQIPVFPSTCSAPARPGRGGLFTARLQIPLVNTISSSVSVVEPDPSRTDIVNYLSRKSAHLVSCGFDQLFELPAAIQAHVGIGAFEAPFAGVGGEVFRLFGGGRFGVGVEGCMVWKRDIENDFALHPTYRKAYHTYHLNLYGRPLPGSGLEMGLRIGRFLAGDEGVRIEACRTFKHFTIGGWYTITDTSGFKSAFNRDYNDKGIFIAFPISIFASRPRPGWFSYAISPWTRDPGQMVGQFRSLYPLGGQVPSSDEMKTRAQEMQW